MGSEAKDPKKNLPRAVVGVLAIVTVLYVLASLALVGMQNYLGEIYFTNTPTRIPLTFN